MIAMQSVQDPLLRKPRLRRFGGRWYCEFMQGDSPLAAFSEWRRWGKPRWMQ